MHLFYIPAVDSKEIVTLSEEESKHCVRVLRLREKDIIQIVDGAGGFYIAKITDANPKKCTAEITEVKKEYEKKNYYLHLVVAPTKNMERLEWFVEKATEIGIDEITLIKCEHSERTIVKTERLNKVAVSAMKQSVKAYIPKINEVISFTDCIKQNFSGQKFIAHCQQNSPSFQGGDKGLVKTYLKNLYIKNKNTLILIGPEGDFSKEEVALALKNNFQEISLGNSRLRTETAAVVACHTIGLMNE